MIKKAMILAAGLGTRLKPWTDTRPKALALINGKSLLQRNVEYLQCFGIRHVIVNVHHFAEQIVSEIDHNQGWGSSIEISDERNEVLETGGGLKKAAAYFDSGDFVLMNADILTTLDINAMMAAHATSGAIATLATRERDTSRYFLFDESARLCGWENIKTGERKGNCTNAHRSAFSGLHVISPSIFPLIEMEGKFSMVDVYLQLASEHVIREFRDSESSFIDVGKPESLAQAESMFL